MNPCKGEPAEKYALAYVEGSLDEVQADRFEEHIISCRVCQKAVIELQDLAEELYENPVDATAMHAKETADSGSRRKPFLLPNLAWGALAFAALLLIGVLVARNAWHGDNSGNSTDQAKTTDTKSPVESTANSATHPAAPTSTTSSGTRSQINATQLADLKLPVFDLRNLRTASRTTSIDTNYLAGMKAYNAGDCRTALDSLSQVPVTAHDPHATQFFTGICQLHLGNLKTANQALSAFADSGDSPQYEWTLYELAQAALAGNDPSTAHSYLTKTISLHGDLEAKAQLEDRKVIELLKTAQQSHKP